MAKVIKPAQAMLCPVPAVLVSCAAPGRRPNIITLAWAGTVCSEPPMVGLGIRPSRLSHELIEAAGEFVVNLPHRALLRATDYCGVVSGRDADKFTALGLTARPGREVKAPLIAECPVNLEARLDRIIPLGSHDLFLGEILAVHIEEELLDEKGRIDPGKFDTFAYGTGGYWAIGPVLGLHGFSRGKAGG